MTKYLIIYNDEEVLSIQPYVAGTAIATNSSFIVDTLETSKDMLEAMGIDIKAISNFKVENI